MNVLFIHQTTNQTQMLSAILNQFIIDLQQASFYVCIIAVITHSLFWLQVICYSSVRQRSVQWLFAYLITDILLLFRYFFLCIVHTNSPHKSSLQSTWLIFVCYFEATVDIYLNTLEVYILLALNICRYIQIVYNKDVYITHVRILICAHLLIYFVPMILYILELTTEWAQVNMYSDGTCDVSYNNIIIQILNLIIVFALPIALNIAVIGCSIHHIHLTSRLNRTRLHVSAREKYHRSLIIQFFIFYIVWLLLWSPNLIVYQFTSGTSKLTTIASLLNFIEIAVDPIIIAALDVRFQRVWSNIRKYIERTYRTRINRTLRQIKPEMNNVTLQAKHIDTK